MSEELYFNNELRKCLNAAGLSDCGENDAWNYWYQRVHKAHDQAVDRVTEAQRVENARLRELVRDYERCSMHADCDRCEYDGTTSTHCPLSPCFPDIDELHELGVEVDE